MTLLSRDQILAANDFKSEVIDVPEWGGQIRIKTLSAAEADSIETGDRTNIRARFAAATICDDSGNLLFSKNDIELLGKKSVKVLNRVIEKFNELNSFSNEELD